MLSCELSSENSAVDRKQMV